VRDKIERTKDVLSLARLALYPTKGGIETALGEVEECTRKGALIAWIVVGDRVGYAIRAAESDGEEGESGPATKMPDTSSRRPIAPALPQAGLPGLPGSALATTLVKQPVGCLNCEVKRRTDVLGWSGRCWPSSMSNVRLAAATSAPSRLPCWSRPRH
jgi:hypothetical protein